MADDIGTKIADAESTLDFAEKTMNSLNKLFMLDGEIDDKEQLVLDETWKQITNLKDKIADLKAQQKADSGGDVSTSGKNKIDLTDEPFELTTNTKKEFGELLYFSDGKFYEAFRNSIANWAQNEAILVNSISTYMNRESSPSGMSVSELLPIVGMVFPEIAVISDSPFLPIAASAFKAALNSTSGDTPSLTEIHAAWMTTILKLTTADLHKQYNAFVAGWKKKEGIPKEQDQIWQNVFMEACGDFAANYMPKQAAIQKAFVSKLLSVVEDGPDWDDNTAGYVDFIIKYIEGNDFGPEALAPINGQIDDAPEQLLEIVKTLYSKGKVIDVPTRIVFTITDFEGRELAVLERKSRKSGDTNFKLSKGDKKYFDIFKKHNGHELPLVSQLRLDK